MATKLDEALSFLNSPAVRWYTPEEIAANQLKREQTKAEEKASRFLYPPDDALPETLTDTHGYERQRAIREFRRNYRTVPTPVTPEDVQRLARKLAAAIPHPTTREYGPRRYPRVGRG